MNYTTTSRTFHQRVLQRAWAALPATLAFLVSSAIYQLDWSALRMGVLPRRIRKLTKGTAHPLMELVAGSLDSVPRATSIGAAQSFVRLDVEQ